MSKSIPFEKVLSELETIVQQLEKGDLSLDDSLKQFEKGISLARQCQNTLNDAEQKISVLTKDQTNRIDTPEENLQTPMNNPDEPYPFDESND